MSGTFDTHVMLHCYLGNSSLNHVYSLICLVVVMILYYVALNMADVLNLPYGLMGSCSLFGSDTCLFRKCFKIAMFYIIIVARPISEFFVQP